MGRLEHPAPVGVSAGERALHVAEHLALDQLGRDGGAVELDEGALAPRREGVDGAGDQLLAGAALAPDEHAALGGGRHLDQLVDPTHGRRAAHHAEPGPVRGRLRVGLALGVRRGHHALEHAAQAVARHRLLQEVGRAVAHGLHGLAHAAVAGDDHHRRAGRLPLHLAEDVDAGAVGQLQVEQHRAGLVLAEEPQAFAHGGGGHRAVAARLQQLDADGAHGVIVVDDEYGTVGTVRHRPAMLSSARKRRQPRREALRLKRHEGARQHVRYSAVPVGRDGGSLRHGLLLRLQPDRSRGPGAGEPSAPGLGHDRVSPAASTAPTPPDAATIRWCSSAAGWSRATSSA